MQCTEYVKIQNNGDLHANYYCEFLLPLQLISTGYEVQIVFITGPNKKRKTGILRKRSPNGRLKVPIASTENIKAVTLNENGMYAYYVIVIFTIQNGLHKIPQNSFHLKSFSMKKIIENGRFDHVC